MIKKLKSLIVNSYAPYSNFVVASIIVYEDGSFFEGVNVENVSFGGTICAERNAIATAISNGKKDTPIKEVHIYAKNNNNIEPEEVIQEFTPPCGLCRQFISEFANEKTKIIMWNEKGKKTEIMFSEIFPLSFEASYLKK